MRILVYTISLCLISSLVWAQVEEVPETPKQDFRPSQLSFGIDVSSIGKTLTKDQTTFEFQSKLDFGKYYLAADFGLLKMDPSGNNFDYQLSGTYFRFGPQVNFLAYSPSRSDLFFGVSYARASFKDELGFDRTGNGWNDEIIGLSNDQVSAHWWEANFGLTVKVVGPLHLGWAMRFKFAKKMSRYNELYPLEIPGFGKAEKGNQFGFHYYLIYKLNFRDKPVPRRPIKIDTEK